MGGGSGDLVLEDDEGPADGDGGGFEGQPEAPVRPRRPGPLRAPRNAPKAHLEPPLRREEGGKEGEKTGDGWRVQRLAEAGRRQAKPPSSRAHRHPELIPHNSIATLATARITPQIRQVKPRTKQPIMAS